MPYEIIFKIFEYLTHDTLKGNIFKLNKLRSVCKFWYNVGDDPRLWHHLNIGQIAPAKFLLSTSVLNSLEARFKNENSVTELKFQKFLTKFMKKTSLTTSCNQNKFKYITKLDLSFLCFLNCDMLKLILANCDANNLKSLNLSFCKRIYLTNSDLVLGDIIAEYCPKLNVLDMTGHDLRAVKTQQRYMNSIGDLLKIIGSNLIDFRMDKSLAPLLSTLCVIIKNSKINYTVKIRLFLSWPPIMIFFTFF